VAGGARIWQRCTGLDWENTSQSTDRFAIAPYWGGGIAGPTANKGPADMNTYDTNARPSQDQIAILRGR